MKFESEVQNGATVRVPPKCEVRDPFAKLITETPEARGQAVPRQALFLEVPGEKPEDKPKEVFIAEHSEAYRPVSNRFVMQLAEQIVETSDISFGAPEIFWDGKRFIGQFVSGKKAEVEVGDLVALGLQVQNSYNASLVFGVQFFAQRLVCSNGMAVPQFLQGFRFKHLNGNTDELVEEAMEHLAAATSRFDALIPRFCALTESPASLDMLAQWVLQLNEGTPRFPRAQIGTVTEQFAGVTSPTVWDLFNAFTYALSHEVSPFTAIEVSERVVDIAFNSIGKEEPTASDEELIE